MGIISEDVPLLPFQSQVTLDAERASTISTLTAIFYIISIFGVVPVVALPGAVIYCGISGFVLVSLLLLIETYTASLLGRTWLYLEIFWPQDARRNRKYPYSAIAEKVGGRILRRVVNFLQKLAILGDSVVFLLLASETLQRVIYGLSDGAINFSFCYCLASTSLAVVPFLWIGTPKDLWYMIWLGAASVGVVSILVLITLIADAPSTYEPPPTFPSWVALAYCFGATSFQFDVHPMILTVQMDMAKKKSLSLALAISFGAAYIVFGAITSTTFFLYGANVTPNVLNSFQDGPLLFTILIAVSFQSLICLALGINTLFQDLEESCRIPDKFGWRRVALRTVVMLVVLFIASSIPHFAIALELVGGLLVTPFIFIFPPIFYLIIKHKASGVLNVKELIVSVNIIVLGIVGCVASTLESGYQISRLPSFAPPCYIDFDKASELSDKIPT